MIAISIQNWNIKAALRSYFAMNLPIHAPPINAPRYEEPYMNPLALPLSFSSSRSTAIASTDTSCSDAKTLFINTRKHSILKPENTLPSITTSPAMSGIAIIARSVNAISDCAISIHGLRFPIGTNLKRSISGPQTHLKAHGRPDNAVIETIVSLPIPLPAR